MSDPNSNLFVSCLPRVVVPNGHENQDPDPNKVGSDPQDGFLFLLFVLFFDHIVV